MQRPANYKTRQKEAVLEFLAASKGTPVTAAHIAESLRNEQISISRPTVYRQLERLVSEGRVRKYSFGGTSASSFRYVGTDDSEQDLYHLKCEICDRVFDLKCDEVEQVSRHISEAHAFVVDESKTIFYGKCKTCRQE